MHAIRLFKKREEFTQCLICAHKCRIKEGRFGVCRTIVNKNGILHSINYGILAAQNADPIEKKPLFHFMPGSYSYSIASPGCNFRCLGCQNADISQAYRDDTYRVSLEYFNGTKRVSPEEVITRALNADCQSISYTYTDPAAFFDYSLDVMKLAHDKGLQNVFVTNGYYTKEAVGASKGLLDAANIDIKFFNDANYRKICGGRLQPVLETIKMLFENNVHIELTTLLIDKYNNTPEEIRDIADFIASIDTDLPWHISRFFPFYKMNDEHITDSGSLDLACNIGKDAGLNYVYAGNIQKDKYENTYCPSCKNLLIKRDGYNILENNILSGSCKFCRYKIYGIF